MRFKSVHADGFGCLQNATMDLARGFNVIFGPNEAGKSTWHAAMYAALCGTRRGAGLTKEDREFRDRFQPWNGNEWRVSARVELQGGNEYDLRHDLDAKVACSVIDSATGKDVSNTVMFDGAPDGSMWLGLNRKLFQRVACIRQAEILGILESAEVLQDQLQKAVASPEAKATASSALERIRAYRRDNVGLDRKNSSRPLAVARGDVKRLSAELEEAQLAHEEYTEMLEQVSQLEARATGLGRQRREIEAAWYRREASELQVKLDRALDLAGKFPGGPPPELEQEGQLTRSVTEALTMWRDRPEVPQLHGDTASELEATIAGLPPHPTGDTVEEPSVSEAARKWELAQSILAEHDSQQPEDIERPPDPNPDPWTLRKLAEELSAEEPAVPEELEEAARAARERATATARPRRKTAVLVGVAALSFALGLSLFLAGIAGGAIAGLLVGAVAGAAALAGRDNSSLMIALQKQTSAEAALASALAERQRAVDRRDAASQKSAELGVDPVPAELRRVATEVESLATKGAALAGWQKRREGLEAELGNARTTLEVALVSRGAAIGPDLGVALRRYRLSCTESAQVAQHASQRDDLLKRLDARQTIEKSAADARARLDDATARLMEAARSVGIEDGEPTELEAKLKQWQQTREEELDANARARIEWEELSNLRADMSEEVRASRIDELQRKAEELFPGDTSDLETQTSIELQRMLETAREAAEGAANEAAAKRGQAGQFAAKLRSVSDCEEAVLEASTRLERISELDAVLKKTEELLSEAEESVQRNVAPVISAFVGPRLERVTRGRYSRVTVNPADLTVTVFDGAQTPRRATGLSHGTAEQVYFLLRAALAEVLGNPDEPAPLLLDDVTVQSDRERTRGILEVLHDLSVEHQVVLFTQEDDVLEWARENLQEPGHMLHELQPLAS